MPSRSSPSKQEVERRRAIVLRHDKPDGAAQEIGISIASLNMFRNSHMPQHRWRDKRSRKRTPLIRNWSEFEAARKPATDEEEFGW